MSLTWLDAWREITEEMIRNITRSLQLVTSLLTQITRRAPRNPSSCTSSKWDLFAPQWIFHRQNFHNPHNDLICSHRVIRIPNQITSEYMSHSWNFQTTQSKYLLQFRGFDSFQSPFRSFKASCSPSRSVLLTDPSQDPTEQFMKLLARMKRTVSRQRSWSQHTLL
jgi:hypothetical protein